MTRFTAGWNMPGYLPEMEPETFDTFDEAKRFIIDALLLQADAAASVEEADVYTFEAEDVNLWGRYGHVETSHVMTDGCVYWVDTASEETTR